MVLRITDYFNNKKQSTEGRNFISILEIEVINFNYGRFKVDLTPFYDE